MFNSRSLLVCGSTLTCVHPVEVTGSRVVDPLHQTALQHMTFHGDTPGGEDTVRPGACLPVSSDGA